MLLGALVYSALATGAFSGAPVANATCVSAFGINNGNGCTSNPTSFAIGIGAGPSACRAPWACSSRSQSRSRWFRQLLTVGSRFGLFDPKRTMGPVDGAGSARRLCAGPRPFSSRHWQSH